MPFYFENNLVWYQYTNAQWLTDILNLNSFNIDKRIVKWQYTEYTYEMSWQFAWLHNMTPKVGNGLKWISHIIHITIHLPISSSGFLNETCNRPRSRVAVNVAISKENLTAKRHMSAKFVALSPVLVPVARYLKTCSCDYKQTIQHLPAEEKGHICIYVLIIYKTLLIEANLYELKIFIWIFCCKWSKLNFCWCQALYI